MSLTAGDKLGPYEVLALIGKGGMGEVYRARDHRLARDVAVKVLLATLSRDSGRLRRFEQEARAAGRLNHPNVLAVYDVGVHDGTPYLVTELLEGESLRARLRRGPIPINKSLEVASDIARGLAAAHEKQIEHRDLKPENLFLTKDGRVKILDFGLAKLKQVGEGGPDASTETALTESGAILGTVGYMSPEQAAAAAVDFRSDQFSFGAILYEMVTNQRAFHRATAVETLSAIIREEPRPIASLAPQTPGPVRWIVERCLAKDPADRFASTHDLARDWDGLRSHLSELTGAFRPGTLAVKRHAPVWVAAALLLGLVAGARTALWWARSKPSETPTLRYLTHSGQDSQPTASPDGRLLAFTSSRDGRPRIWLKQLAGGGEAPLTEGPDGHPRFSPDGSMILFVRTDQTRTALYRTPIVGGHPRKLVDDAHHGDWSPDGRQIAFVRAPSSIGVVDAGGGSPRTLVQLENRALSFPRWSPDGRAIAMIETPLGAYARPSLLLVPVDGKPPRSISPPGSFLISSPAWCGPDEVVYSQADTVVAAGYNTGATARVFRQSVRSGEARQVFWTPHNSQTLDILGPGKLVFDTRSSRQSLRGEHP